MNVFAAYHTAVHSSAMTPNISDVPKLLRAIMDSKGWTQESLGSRLGVDQPQISRWLKGQKPNGANYEQILFLAQSMGLVGDIRSEDVADALPAPSAPTKKVPIKGYVGAGEEGCCCPSAWD